ncbi:hypothetical protein BJ138DRAFT_1219063 [Hygrophoropsis aurantiaca]|uniref:Uncharacterized protein n=1 Tax=Hygrophoropsis aurantiaca TaxID=72124 RepID=A0ACB8A052_9AGAM|nr:hypothetical protein BJ138DRAFT_1219063 [Hygrophoropsis aurantiaca]
MPELWLLIFQHVSPRQLHEVTLTCHLFRQLAQPLLFRSLSFHPYSLDSQGGRHLRKFDSLERMQRRIAFCTSDSIRYAVQDCRFLPHYSVLVRMGQFDEDSSKANAMLDLIISALPRFINLRALAFLFVDLNQAQVIQLCRLHLLDAISLCHCSIASISDQSIRSLVRTSKLQILSDKAPPLIRYQLGFSVLDPSHLQSVAFNNIHVVELFMQDLLAAKVLPSLRTLSIPSSVPLIRDIVLLLHNLPALEQLTLTRSGPNLSLDHDFANVPTPVLARPLHAFHGPYQLATKFIGGETLRELTLWDGHPSSEAWRMQPTDIQDTLWSIRAAIHNVETLKISVTCVDDVVLDTVCSVFPRLRTIQADVSYGLHIQSSASAYDFEVFMGVVMGSKFPSTMERLWINSQSLAHPLSQQELNTYAFYKRRLLEIYPGLSFVSLDDCDLTMSWVSS